jgi:hypothetical protein
MIDLRRPDTVFDRVEHKRVLGHAAGKIKREDQTLAQVPQKRFKRDD